MPTIIAMLYWAVLVSNEEAPVPNITSIEKQVLSYRQSIQRGHVIFKQKTYKDKIYAPRFDRVTTIWFDGKKVRNDDLFRYGDEPEAAPMHRDVSCRNCEKDGYWVNYNDKRFPRGDLAVSMSNMALNHDPEAFGIVHPRLLGMVLESVPNLATSRAHLESLIGRPGRENMSIRRTHWKKHECLQISFKLPPSTDIPTLPPNADVRLWISSDQGPSVVRIEGEGDFRGKRYSGSVESDLRQHMPSGLWYPQSVVYEQRVDGKSVEKEVTDVQVISLNEPIAPETFTLAGMNLPVDKPVAIADKREKGGGLKYWDGKELVTKSTSRHPPPVFRSRSSTRRWLLIVNSVFFALLAVFLFWRRWRRAKTT